MDPDVLLGWLSELAMTSSRVADLFDDAFAAGEAPAHEHWRVFALLVATPVRAGASPGGAIRRIDA